MAFLVTIASARRMSELTALSCKEPFLVLHHVKMMLCPHLSFLAGVVFSFSLELGQCLLFPSSQLVGKRLLHTLNIVQVVRIYLHCQHWLESWLVLLEKHWKVSIQAYSLKGQNPTLAGDSFSARYVDASWTIRH